MLGSDINGKDEKICIHLTGEPLQKSPVEYICDPRFQHVDNHPRLLLCKALPQLPSGSERMSHPCRFILCINLREVENTLKIEWIIHVKVNPE